MEFPSGQLYFMASRVAARKKELLKWFLLVMIGDRFFMIVDEWCIFCFVDMWPVHHNGNGQSEDEDANEGAQATDQLNMYISVFLYSSIFAFLNICISVFQCSLQFLCTSIFVSTGGKSFDQLKLIKHVNFVLLSGKTRGKLSCIMFKGVLVLCLAY